MYPGALRESTASKLVQLGYSEKYSLVSSSRQWSQQPVHHLANVCVIRHNLIMHSWALLNSVSSATHRRLPALRTFYQMPNVVRQKVLFYLALCPFKSAHHYTVLRMLLITPQQFLIKRGEKKSIIKNYPVEIIWNSHLSFPSKIYFLCG